MAAEKEFPGLDGDALKATEAIFQDGQALGAGFRFGIVRGHWRLGWRRCQEIAQEPRNTLAYLKKIQPFLEDKEIILEIGTGKQPYSVYEKAPRTAGAPAATAPATSAVPIGALQMPDLLT